jgi:hypothetical protein
MELETIRAFFAWCSVINLVLLLWWAFFLLFAHDWTYRMHSKWFRISVEKFDAIHYAAMATFKLGLFMFNLVPYFALRIIG